MKHTIYLIATIVLFTACKQRASEIVVAEEIVTEVPTSPTAVIVDSATINVKEQTSIAEKTEIKKINANSQIPENGIYTYKIIDIELGNQQTGTAKVTINGTYIKIRDSFEGEAYSGKLIQNKEYGNGWVIMTADDTEFSIDFNKKEIYYY